jgi:hypothetical protein
VPAFDADGLVVSAGAFVSFEPPDAPPKSEPLSGEPVLFFFESGAYAFAEASGEELREASFVSGERSAKF